MLLSDYGYDQGFDLFVASGLKPAVPKWHQQPALFRGARGIARKVWQRFWRERTLWLPYTSAPALNRAAMAWLRQVKKPFFLWIHYMDVHNPYYPPPSHLERVTGHTISRRRMTYLARKEIHKKPMSASEIKDTIDLYDGCIAYVDSAVREIDSTLSELGLRDETVLIVTADHGEEFMEHGGTIHSAKMYDELLRVPLVIRAPGSPSGSVINEQVSLLGLSPTLLDLVGLPQFPGFVGHSLKPLLDEQVGEGDNLVFSHCYHQGGRVRFSASEGATLFALRTPEWKYIYDEESNQDELYDLKSDPNEQVNLVALEPEKRHWFRQALSRHIESLPGYKSERTPEIPQVEDDENILERLRALGYLD
jgi:arylsulfatase A-like enzyme